MDGGDIGLLIMFGSIRLCSNRFLICCFIFLHMLGQQLGFVVSYHVLVALYGNFLILSERTRARC